MSDRWSKGADWLTPLDVAWLTGFSASFIRAEIKSGELPAVLVTSPSRPRQRGRWRIARVDAQAYATRIGVTQRNERDENPQRTERIQRTDEITPTE